MGRFSVDLAAGLVDHPASLDAHTRIDIGIEPSAGRLRVENREGAPRSVHRFTTDPSDLGLGGASGLTGEQAALVLAIACTLRNDRVLFAPLQHHPLPTRLERDPILPRVVKIVDTPTGRRTTWAHSATVSAALCTITEHTVRLDEGLVVDVVNRLLRRNMFGGGLQAIPDLNVVEALKSYGRAIESNDGLSCYALLYQSFEKSVNADDPNRKETFFDAHASMMTGHNAHDIEELRRFDNRIKHALRNGSDWSTLRASEAQLAQLAFRLKSAADRAILSRI